MQGRCSRWLLSLTALALLAGCGGSGSSGFEPSPSGLEARVIEQAIAERSCLPLGELTICAVGAAAPSMGNAPGVSDLVVDARVDRRGFDACVRSGLGACPIVVAVTGDGVPPDAELCLAVRLATDAPWQLGEPFRLPATNGPADAPTPVGLDVRPEDGDDAPLQVAVLVFAGASPPLPGEVEDLASTGARWAFVAVTSPLEG